MSAIARLLCATPPAWQQSDARGGRRSRFSGRLRRLRLVLLLAGWVFATGSHWDLVQVGAWARMWFEFAQVQPVGQALASTFSPEAMCGVCQTVQAAKSDRGDDPLPGIGGSIKPLLIVPRARPIVIEGPRFAGEATPPDARMPEAFRPAPPVPPPRGTCVA